MSLNRDAVLKNIKGVKKKDIALIERSQKLIDLKIEQISDQVEFHEKEIGRNFSRLLEPNAVDIMELNIYLNKISQEFQKRKLIWYMAPIYDAAKTVIEKHYQKWCKIYQSPLVLNNDQSPIIHALIEVERFFEHGFNATKLAYEHFSGTDFKKPGLRDRSLQSHVAFGDCIIECASILIEALKNPKLKLIYMRILQNTVSQMIAIASNGAKLENFNQASLIKYFLEMGIFEIRILENLKKYAQIDEALLRLRNFIRIHHAVKDIETFTNKINELVEKIEAEKAKISPEPSFVEVPMEMESIEAYAEEMPIFNENLEATVFYYEDQIKFLKKQGDISALERSTDTIKQLATDLLQNKIPHQLETYQLFTVMYFSLQVCDDIAHFCFSQLQFSDSQDQLRWLNLALRCVKNALDILDHKQPFVIEDKFNLNSLKVFYLSFVKTLTNKYKEINALIEQEDLRKKAAAEILFDTLMETSPTASQKKKPIKNQEKSVPLNQEVEVMTSVDEVLEIEEEPTSEVVVDPIKATYLEAQGNLQKRRYALAKENIDHYATLTEHSPDPLNSLIIFIFKMDLALVCERTERDLEKKLDYLSEFLMLGTALLRKVKLMLEQNNPVLKSKISHLLDWYKPDIEKSAAASEQITEQLTRRRDELLERKARSIANKKYGKASGRPHPYRKNNKTIEVENIQLLLPRFLVLSDKISALLRELNSMTPAKAAISQSKSTVFSKPAAASARTDETWHRNQRKRRR